jgi:ankyrin repeat protein
MAAQTGQTDCVQILVDHKADVNQAFQGWSPLMFAKHYQHSAMVEILLAAGAK